jgi:gliding motility-associated-like protein
MHKRICCLVFPILMLFITNCAYSQQQDVDFHINAHLFAGQKILKVKRDFGDPYVWVLAQNNVVYRVNSITLAVDNYTGKFAGFSSDAIIDIAGYNQDTLWAATRSKIINCYKDIAQLSTFTNSIAYPINSIGMSNFGYGGEYYGLAIGTDSTEYSYDLYRKQFLTYNYVGHSQIFEATYRRFMRSDYYYAYSYDTTKSIPVVISDATGGYSTGIWKGGPFGQWPNTAFYSTTGLYEIGFNANLYWGTDNGFFEIWNDYNYFNGGNYNHYLNGIKINKITDIYGLTNFTRVDIHNHLFTKENLLIGSDNGFYFTNSIFYAGMSGPNELNNITLFHYDPLGNVAVNDICVNVTASPTVGLSAGCENGVWVGTDDGLYLLTPDYGKYIDPNDQITALYVNMPGGDTISHLQICSGSSVPLLINPYTINNNTIQWVKNGQNIIGQTGNQLTVADSGDYNAILLDPCDNVHIQTNHIKVSLIAGPQFTFNYPDTVQYCDSASTTLKTTNSPSYHYRWYQNDVLNGDTTFSCTVTQTGKYKVEVSACTNSWVPSKEVQVILLSVPDPGISIDKSLYCQGDIAHFTSTWLMDTTAYTLRWYKDNKLLPSLNNQFTIKTAIPGSYTLSITDNKTLCSKVSPAYQLSFTPPPSITFNYPDKIQQCDNTPLTLQTTDNPGYTYRWYTNGVLNGNTTSSYAVTQTGKYKVEVSACTNSWVPSKEVEVDLVTLPVPQVTSDKAVYCAEDIAVLTENAPADPSYTINWYRDGTLLTADNNLTTINETTPGSYTVTLASTLSTCTQPSAALPLAFTPAPVFTFNYPNQLQYCEGTPLTLRVTGSAGYQYRWYKDGTLNGVTTTSLPVTENGKYKVEVSSCAGSWIASKEAQVTFIKVPVPSISTDKPAYCIGDNATLSLAETIDPDYTTQWYKDNVPVPNSASQNSIITNVPGSYTVDLTYNTPNTDGSTCTQSSAVQALTFNPLPTVSIEKIVNTTICEGQTIGLKANYNGGTVQWSTGETTDQISVTQAGNYQVTVTSSSGCQAETNIDVAFLPNPVFSVNDTTICTYKKQVITLTAPAGFAQYAWNGQTGNQTYQVSLPQTVSLTVTDANGCQATQQIKVADQCPNIYIPNTFTPNGDSINDTWVIEGLDYDPSSTVKVFTRNGILIFNSIGYGTPWNGEYKGQKLPAGAYYYIVTAKNSTQKFSGSLTIIY